jgi:hypothetical protein
MSLKEFHSLQGSPLFTRLRVEDGVKKGKVVLLEDMVTMEAELEKATEFMKVLLYDVQGKPYRASFCKQWVLPAK